MLISAAQRQQYRDEGYFILERVIPPAHLRLLRGELELYIRYIHDEMDRQKTDVIGINHRDRRYFIMNRYAETGRLREVLFSDYLADICRATIGDDAWLLNEQYAVKCANTGTKFSWHQDSGYVSIPHRPWVTCWLALDDMSEANGTIYVLPYSRAGGRQRVEHVRDPQSNDMVGYHGTDEGIAVEVPAGSIAVFSSVTFHRSGANTSDAMRRAYTPEFGPAPLLDPNDPAKSWALNHPFLRNGRCVAHG